MLKFDSTDPETNTMLVHADDAVVVVAVATTHGAPDDEQAPDEQEPSQVGIPEPAGCRYTTCATESG